MNVAVLRPRRMSARCWSSGSRTSAWMPDRYTRPRSWVYLASSENSPVGVVMSSPCGAAALDIERRPYSSRERRFEQATATAKPETGDCRFETVARGLGECGGHFWAPAYGRLEEVDGCPPYLRSSGTR